jgi:predicted 3-demethylubiquinone-9 3-methyltransferase (glyoxalase superfamily)
MCCAGVRAGARSAPARRARYWQSTSPSKAAPFKALNGGPHFKFNEAVSFFVECKDQAEVDMFWDKLTADGGLPSQCGWLKDKFGLSWQIVPVRLMALMTDPDAAKAARVTQAMLKMQKIDVATLERAAAA